MRSRKIAVVGLQMGAKHLECWAACPGAEVAAIADLDRERAAALGKKFNIPNIFSDYKDLLANAKADIVSNCLPTGMHARSTLQMLDAGFHVLCEKPPACNAEEAEKMADRAEKSGRILGYSFQRRFSEPVHSAKAVVAAGRIGEPYWARAGYCRHLPVRNLHKHLGWRYDRNRGGGSLLDLGVHLLDAAWYVMGCPKPLTVTATASDRMIPAHFKGSGSHPPTNPAEDTANALIRFEGNKTLFLETSFGFWRVNGPECYCDISGTEGGIQVYPKPAQLVSQEHLTPFPFKTDLPFEKDRERMVSDFLEATNGKHPPRITARQGVVLMSILDAMAESAEAGAEIAVP